VARVLAREEFSQETIMHYAAGAETIPDRV
jgi:hypothetical protein